MIDYDETRAKELLGQVYTPEGVAIWWKTRNRNLSFYTPANIWATDKRWVRLEINRLVEGNHE